MTAQRIEIDGRFHFLTVTRDITAQKRAEEALRRTETRYRDLVENANDIIFTVDPEGYCVSMNRVGQEVTGYPIGGTARGVNLRQLVAPEELSMVLGKLQRVMAGEDVPPFELDVISTVGVVSRMREPLQPMVAAELALARTFLRHQIKRLFSAELAAMVPARAQSALAAVDVICSFEGWQLLRLDQKLDPDDAATVLIDSVTTLFGQPQ